MGLIKAAGSCRGSSAATSRCTMPSPDPIITPQCWAESLSPATLFPSPGNPLAVDVGCGKGRYLLARAHRCPEMNFLGIDRMGSRMHKLRRKLVRADMHHVRLAHVEAAYAIRHLLPPESVALFTVFFPDPWPKRRHHRRRLFCPAFLDDLVIALQQGGHLHVATDHLEYFDAIAALLATDERFRSIAPYTPPPEEMTDFEIIFTGQGKPIGRASFEKL